jgi:hypothetical protein
MKKVILFAAVCAMFAACKDGKNTSVAPAADSVAADSAVYSGLVPSADGAGIPLSSGCGQRFYQWLQPEEAYMKSDTEVDTLLNYQGKLDKFTTRRVSTIISSIRRLRSMPTTSSWSTTLP